MTRVTIVGVAFFVFDKISRHDSTVAARSVFRSLKNEEKEKKLGSRCTIACQRNTAALLAEITRPRNTNGYLRSCRNESFVPLLITWLPKQQKSRKSCQLGTNVANQSAISDPGFRRRLKNERCVINFLRCVVIEDCIVCFRNIFKVTHRKSCNAHVFHAWNDRIVSNNFQT